MHVIRLTGYASLAAMVCAGCGPTAATSDKSVVAEPSVVVDAQGKQTVTLRVHEMGQRLKLLGADGPNRVKQALDGLEGVELVEDDWELAEDEHREADADLLYVTFDPEKIAESDLIKAIQNEGFEAGRDGNKSASRRR